MSNHNINHANMALLALTALLRTGLRPQLAEALNAVTSECCAHSVRCALACPITHRQHFLACLWRTWP
jgi:hypothetical protein